MPRFVFGNLFVNKSILCLWFLAFSCALAQVPTISCPNYFQYLNENSHYIGRIILPNIKPGLTRVEVHLSQPGVVPTPNPSRLSLYDDQSTTVNKVLTAQPISYRVEFPLPYALPKLTLISVNGAILCADHDYPPPSSQVKLTHALEMTAFSSLVPYKAGDNAGGNGFTGNLATAASNPFTQNQRPQTQQGQQKTEQPTYNTNYFNPYANFGITAGGGTTTTAPSPTASASNNEIFRPSSNTNLNDVCGHESAAFTPLIRGGSQLKRGQFPWLTAIYRKKGTDLAFICGGSLLSTRTVISAAHCFKEQNIAADKILLLLGRHNLATLGEEGSVYRQVQSLSLHPQYNTKAIADADIAILQLQQPVSFTAYIKPICLWSLADDVNYIVGYAANVAGWGATENGDPVSLVPKKVQIQIVDEPSCRNDLQRFQVQQTSRTLCGRSQGSDGPCTGDSGGGLMIFTQGRWLLRGIVSAGLTRYGQCTPNENFYFCDVAKHFNWISSQILS